MTFNVVDWPEVIVLGFAVMYAVSCTWATVTSTGLVSADCGIGSEESAT